MGAFFALLAAVVARVVPFAETFSGFGHPATVTVALVLVISREFKISGAVDLTGGIYYHRSAQLRGMLPASPVSLVGFQRS